MYIRASHSESQVRASPCPSSLELVKPGGGRDVPPCSHLRLGWLRGVIYRSGGAERGGVRSRISNVVSDLGRCRQTVPRLVHVLSCIVVSDTNHDVSHSNGMEGGLRNSGDRMENPTRCDSGSRAPRSGRCKGSGAQLWVGWFHLWAVALAWKFLVVLGPRFVLDACPTHAPGANHRVTLWSWIRIHHRQSRVHPCRRMLLHGPILLPTCLVFRCFDMHAVRRHLGSSCLIPLEPVGHRDFPKASLRVPRSSSFLPYCFISGSVR